MFKVSYYTSVFLLTLLEYQNQAPNKLREESFKIFQTNYNMQYLKYSRIFMDIIQKFWKLLKIVTNNLPILVHVGMLNAIRQKRMLQW